MNFLESVAPPLYRLYILSPFLFCIALFLMGGSLFVLSFLYKWSGHEAEKDFNDGFSSGAHHNIRSQINIHAIKNQKPLSTVFKNRESDPYNKPRLMGIVFACVLFTGGVLMLLIIGS